MNKLFIVLLAVCLVSVHAFSKRDTAPQNENYIETIQKQLQDITNQINQKVSTAFDPEQVKKGFNDVVDNLNKAFNELKAKSATTPSQ